MYCGRWRFINSPNADHQLLRYQEVAKIPRNQNKFPGQHWDYQGVSDFLQKAHAGLFDYNLNIPLVTMLGLAAPLNQTYTFRADSVGFPQFIPIIAEKCSNRVIEVVAQSVLRSTDKLKQRKVLSGHQVVQDNMAL